MPTVARKGLQCDQALEEVPQRCCGDSVPEEVQNLPGHSPEQPAAAGPASSSRVGLGDPQRSLPTSASVKYAQ